VNAAGKGSNSRRSTARRTTTTATPSPTSPTCRLRSLAQRLTNGNRLRRSTRGYGNGVRCGWDQSTPGVVALPSGRLVRGRALSEPLAPGPQPHFGLYLLRRRPAPFPWQSRWLQWPDFRLPTDRDDAREALSELWRRAAGERVEVACRGGRGRTGTALACVAVIDGVPAEQAVSFVRQHYHRQAVETRRQQTYVARFAFG
jgi:Protein-tyrosine phosphatase